MTYIELYNQILKKKSFLCVGLDSDMDKLPFCLKTDKNPQFNFNKSIIDATAQYAISYKLNLAFYECRGADGWHDFELTVNYIKKNYPDIFIIADAKRGDIGNTSAKYAEAFFKHSPCDAVTVAPYMGEDSIKPFLGYEGKWVIILALTSNKGADDFQFIKDEKLGRKLFELVLLKSKSWATHNQIMFVAGATRPELLKEIRTIIPHYFLLIPGVGAQGGDLSKVATYGLNESCGLIINSSREIIFADNTEKFAEKAAEKAKILQQQMEKILMK